MKFSYFTELGVTEVLKTYLNSDNVFNKRYFKENNKVKYFANNLKVAQEIKFDINGNLIKNGGKRLSCHFDEKDNWIEKYDDGELVEKRKITYK